MAKRNRRNRNQNQQDTNMENEVNETTPAVVEEIEVETTETTETQVSDEAPTPEASENEVVETPAIRDPQPAQDNTPPRRPAAEAQQRPVDPHLALIEANLSTYVERMAPGKRLSVPEMITQQRALNSAVMMALRSENPEAMRKVIEYFHDHQKGALGPRYVYRAMGDLGRSSTSDGRLAIRLRAIVSLIIASTDPAVRSGRRRINIEAFNNDIKDPKLMTALIDKLHLGG